MRYKRKVLALGAFFVLAVAVAGCGGSSIPGNSVAVVAGNPISTAAFNHWMYVAAKSADAEESSTAPVIVPNDPPDFNKCIADVRASIPSLAKTSAKTLRSDCKQLFTSLSSQVMQFLITAYWYQADAAKQHIKVTNAEVQKAFKTAKSEEFPTASDFNAFLSETGQTLQDIIYRFRINEVETKLIAKYPTKVTSARIKQYYDTHLSQFGTKEMRDMRIVLTDTASEANAAKAALVSGQSWKAVAKKYSTDAATKNSGGQLTNVTEGEEDAALNKAAFSAPLNKLVGPVKGQFGYYVVQVTKITPATQESLAKATPTIKQTLTTTLQTDAENAVNKRAKKDWLSKTKCRAEYAIASYCGGYKAPKTATTSSTTG